MFDQEFLDTDDRVPANLEAEIDTIAWNELARHFAFGRLYVVRKPWNLLEAATIIKDDKAERLKSAMANGDFGHPTPEEATEWHTKQQAFDVLVLDPFVLVSPKE